MQYHLPDENRLDLLKHELEELVRINKSIITILNPLETQTSPLPKPVFNTLTCVGGNTLNLPSKLYKATSENTQRTIKKTQHGDFEIVKKKKVKIKNYKPRSKPVSKKNEEDDEKLQLQNVVKQLQIQNQNLVDELERARQVQELQFSSTEERSRSLEKYEAKLSALFNELLDASRVMQESRGKFCEMLKQHDHNKSKEKYKQMKVKCKLMEKSIEKQRLALEKVTERFQTSKNKEEFMLAERKNLRKLITKLAKIIRQNQKTMKQQEDSLLEMNSEKSNNTRNCCAEVCEKLNCNDDFCPSLSQELEELMNDFYVEINRNYMREEIVRDQKLKIDYFQNVANTRQEELDRAKDEILNLQKELTAALKEKELVIEKFKCLQYQMRDLEQKIQEYCHCKE